MANKKESQLDELIEEGKWKSALKLCETRQKKGDKTPALQVRRIIVLLSFRETSRVLQGNEELNALIQKQPPIADYESLKQLDLFLSTRKERHDLADSLWMIAGLHGQDEEFLTAWFRLKLEQGRWTAAQKAAQIWQKSFPQKRTPYFLWILSSHLVSTTPSVAERDRTLARGLSYQCLKKAIAATPSWKSGESDPPSPPRAINTEEELLLLIRIYKSQHRYSEALGILEDSRTGYLSHLSKASWEVARQMIELNELCEQWEAQWNMCSTILAYAKPHDIDTTGGQQWYDFGGLGDDWKVWDALITASEKLIATSSGPEAQSRYKTMTAFIAKFCQTNPSRNAELASFKFLTLKAVQVICHEQQLPTNVDSYFQTYCPKVSCFQDLRPYVSALHRGQQEEVLRQMDACASRRRPAKESDDTTKMHWVTTETNVRKFEYHFVISRDDKGGLDGLLPAFVRRCLQLYSMALLFDFKLPPSDRLPGDDAAMLAAMALVRMYKLRNFEPSWSNSLGRGIAVLEFALSKSRHNYDILLILVRLYMFLGAGSLAMERYLQLSIKNIQLMTISWVIYTRISTIHPHPMTVSGTGNERVTINPLTEMIDALGWHTRASHLSLQSLSTFQRNGQWNSEVDLLETHSAIHNGFTRLLLLAESFRVQRFQDPERHHGRVYGPYHLPTEVKDSRDRKAFPDYEAAGQSAFEELLPSADHGYPSATSTTEDWLARSLRQASIWEDLCGYHHYPERTTDGIVASLLASTSAQESQDDTQSTIEHTVFHSCGLLSGNYALIRRKLDLHHWKQPSKDHDDLVASSLEAVSRMLNAFDTAAWKLPQGWRDVVGQDGQFICPQWSVLGTYFGILEICQYVHKFTASIAKLDTAKEVPPWLSKLLTDLRKSCKNVAGKVWTSATNLRAAVENQAFFDKFHETIRGETDEVAKQMSITFGDVDFLSDVCKKLQRSWVDALDGVIRTKVVD